MQDKYKTAVEQLEHGMQLHLPSPLHQIFHPIFEEQGCEVWIKRDDMIHPFISGNKWRKLKYNVMEAIKKGKNTLVSFGGAYSNHLLALAAVGNMGNFQTIGIVRGEEPIRKNDILKKMSAFGMKLVYLPRVDYRGKEKIDVVSWLGMTSDECMVIPEGGANVYALPGVAEIWEELPMPFDYIVTAMGTGTTFAGLMVNNPGTTVVGIPVLKEGEWLLGEAIKLLKTYDQIFGRHPGSKLPPSVVITDYHFGGYAKQPEQLRTFCEHFFKHTGVKIEPIYTGKMMYGLIDLLQKDYFFKGAKILVLHTGGIYY